MAFSRGQHSHHVNAAVKIGFRRFRIGFQRSSESSHRRRIALQSQAIQNRKARGTLLTVRCYFHGR
jgi:hypothetical protein